MYNGYIQMAVFFIFYYLILIYRTIRQLKDAVFNITYTSAIELFHYIVHILYSKYICVLFIVECKFFLIGSFLLLFGYNSAE